MSTKISKAARRHLLRVVERLAFPMRMMLTSDSVRGLADAMMAHGPLSLPPGHWHLHLPGAGFVIGGVKIRVAPRFEIKKGQMVVIDADGLARPARP